MSSRGSENKRKYSWTSQNAKRFQGSSNPREELHRGNGSRWDRSTKAHDRESFSKQYRNQGRGWGSRERTNYDRSRYPTSNKNYNPMLDYPPLVSAAPPKESEEVTGPGSDVQRMEKVLATKKRIEEALAAQPPNASNREINFKNSSISSIDKNKVTEPHCSNLDLSLTNSDFKEIGSVASAVPTEVDIETTDVIINASPKTTIHTPQVRSFDSTTLNPPITVQPPQQKQQRVGGWSMSAVNDIVSDPNRSKSCSPKQRNNVFLQEQREEILGSVSTQTKEKVVDSSNKQYSNNQNKEFSRVGRLYVNFLKSRLFGYTLKLRDKSPKPTGPNPLLDKSVLENHNSDKRVSEDQVLELQIPYPIQIKMENTRSNTELECEPIGEEEAQDAIEFCQDYSYLLKDPNFLIPPDDLEKLGLGHLSEMNKLISDKRTGGVSDNPLEIVDCFSIRNVDPLNTVAGSNIAVNVNKDPLGDIGQTEIIDRFKERDRILNNGLAHYDYLSPSGSQNPSLLDRTHITPLQSPRVSPFHNVSVEEVVEKVVKTILHPSNINSVLKSGISSSDARTNTAKNQTESHLLQPGTSFTDTRNTQSNQMQDVSSKILRLFLIDKQVEELMAEKMKIYSELLSSQDVTQTLFHSWAQDQIQQGNVMNVISNTSNAVPELNRVINRSAPETNPLETPNTLEETISELYTLKKEYGNPDMTIQPMVETEVNESSDLPPDSCFVTPKVVEENRPKLSVRKDLLDPNVNFFTPPVIPTEDDGNPSSDIASTDIDKTNVKRQKKKKKNKKKDSVEIINLIEDTDDEISSGTAVDSVATDDEVDKRDAISLKVSYKLDEKNATCITVMRVKKTPVLIAGCKDGSVMGYTLGNPTVVFTKKIHEDTITVVSHYKHYKYLITGSADKTICLFSLKKQVQTQTLTVNAAVQSMDINFEQLIIGTKTGSIFTYEIKVSEEDEKKVMIMLLPNKKSISITNSSILAVKLAKEGDRNVLIVASRGEQITVRDANTGFVLRTFDWCDTVFCLQLYEDTPLVYCGTHTKSVKVVNYTDGENAGYCMMGRSITQIIFLYSVMFAASYDGNIYIYDIERNSLLATVMVSRGIIQCLAVDEKSNAILVASSRGDLQQIPIPASVNKHLRKLRNEKRKSLNQTPMQT